MTFGQRLRKARVAKGLSQEELGKGLGVSEPNVSKQTVYGWEKDSHSPTARQLALICERLEESADSLLFGKEANRDLRNLNGLEGQLILMFRGLVEEDQEKLLQQANNWFSRSNPERSAGNPYGNSVFLDADTYSGSGRRQDGESSMIGSVGPHQKEKENVSNKNK